MINVTQGNPVPLRIQLKKGGVVFDLSDSSDISVTIVGAKVSKRLDEPVVVDGSIKVTVPATMGAGFYGIEIKGTRFNKPWRTKYARVLELTDITTLSNNGKVKYIGEGDYFDIVMTVDLYESGESSEVLEELARLRGEVASLTGELADMEAEIQEKDAVIARKDAVISEKEAVISGLEGDLQESQQQLSDMTDERDKATLFIGSYLGGGADIEVPGRGELNIRYGTIEVPAGITEIGTGVFRERTDIQRIDFGDVEVIGGYTCYNCTTLQSVRAENAVNVGESAFRGCSSLTDVHLPNFTSVTGNSQFNNCTSLVTVSLPNLVSAGQSVFAGCRSLKNVSLPRLRTASNSFFQNCNELEEISLPSLVTLGSGMFTGCESLRKVEFASLTGISVNAPLSTVETLILHRDTMVTLSNTGYISNTCTVYVPDELIDTYKTATNWRNHAEQIRGSSEYVE